MSNNSFYNYEIELSEALAIGTKKPFEFKRDSFKFIIMKSLILPSYSKVYNSAMPSNRFHDKSSDVTRKTIL